VNVVDLDDLVVTAPMPIECLQQVSLQFESLDGVAAIDVDAAPQSGVPSLTAAGLNR